MTRPATRLVLLAAAALPLTACATFTDDNVAARVGDAELGYGEFEQRVRLIDERDVERIPVDTARTVISNWIALELSRGSGLVDRYAAGPNDSGVLCVSAINVADITAADAAVDALRGGADWGAFVAETNPAATLAGRQECIPTAAIGDLASQIDGLSADDPFRSLAFDDGAVAVLRMQPVNELNGFELLRVYQSVDADAVEAIVALGSERDVYVDPLFGTFDAEQFGVAPLG